MFFIKAPINPNSNPDVIANLHKALKFLGFELNPGEENGRKYDDTTRKGIVTFQRQFQIPGTDGFVDEVTATRLNEVLKERGAFDNVENYKIKGRVTTDIGTPIIGVKAIAFLKRLDDDSAAGETITGTDGSYTVTFPVQAGTTKPDIQVRVVETVNGQKELGRSAVKFNAGLEETLDIIVPTTKVEKEAEYQRLLKDVQPHLGRVAMKDLQEVKEKEQISYLANKTSWDSRMVAMMAQSHKLSAETNIPANHYYALFRAGVTNDATITQLSPQTIETILVKAADQKIVQKDDSIKDTVTKLRNLAVDTLLKNKAASSVSNLASMLDLRLNEAQKRVFVESAQDAAGNNDKLWSSLKQKGFEETTVKRLQLDGQLGFLTKQNAPMVKRLTEAHRISSPVDLVHQGFYKKEQWIPVIGNDIPAGATAVEYAAHMANHLAVSYPTAVASEMLARDELKLSANIPRQEVSNFLNSNQQKFTIGLQPVKKWEGYNTLTNEAKTGVKTVERLYQLSPSNNAMMALSAAGLTSAYEITKFSKSEFLQKHSESFANANEAELTYQKASEVQSAVMNLATTYLTYRGLPNIYSLTGKFQKVQNEIIAYPTLEELFGNMDYCACDHCKSVLSPAAYLVDLLQFIDLADVPHEKQNPINVLISRRPDIQHIQLSCENTNTILPYIDVVNEMLEYYVVNGSLTPVINGSPVPYTGHNIAEDINTVDLLADPQFVIEAAYNEVKTKVYPYNLPFDYPLEASRLFFNAWDTSLAESLSVFSNAAAARQERLGLNEEEYKILTGSSTHLLPEFFGKPPATTIPDLNTAISNGKIFSRAVDISYEELVRLLKTNFINPGYALVPLLSKTGLSLATLQSFYTGAITDAALDALLPADLDTALFRGGVKQWLRNGEKLIMGMITLTDVGPQASECNFAEVQLRFALPDNANNSLNALAYHKLNRFIRLWKKSGWSIEVTDAVMRYLTPEPFSLLTDANINPTFVVLLARISNLKRILAQLSASDKKLPDFLMLWDTAKAEAVRHEQCARLLKISVDDVLDLASMTGTDPLANDMEQDEPSLMRFVRIVQSLKEASLKIADLNYLLRHKDNTGKLITPDAVMLRHIRLLRASLNAVEKEHSIAPDNADFSFAKSKMALVYDASVVDHFFGLLTGTKTYAETFNTVEEGLPGKVTVANAALGYDPFKKQITYNGILSALDESTLKAAADSLVLTDMGVITAAGDLATFKTALKTAIEQLGIAAKEDMDLFAAAYPELKTVFDNVTAQPDPAAQTTALLTGILPELTARLKSNVIKQALSGITKADAEVISVLTAEKETLQSSADNTKPVLHDFLLLEQKLVFNANVTYSFYLDAPATDDYLIYIKASPGTVITLSVNGQIIINNLTAGASGEVQNSAALHLPSGDLHLVQLAVTAMAAGSSAELWWRTKGMAKGPVPAANLYSKESAGFAITSLIRLQKASSLSRLLKLTAKEIRYFASHNNETKNIFNELDTDGTITAASLENLWDKLHLLLYFVTLKKGTEQEENTWVQILENPAITNTRGDMLISALNNWKPVDLDQVLLHFSLTLPQLSDLRSLEKVISAMKVVSAVDFPALSVIAWSVANPTAQIIKSIKEQIRKKTSEAAWLETMQSVSDALRNKQRDALVSYILYHRKPSPEVDTANKLYEFFLVDVQMDACMKTSRIKQAISTVQLFVHRCLMNLEPNVAPASIRAHQWQWMMRYRVWEANRKVFLYPENWLEPELRDNKSSFFRELEGELLQSDINDELAEKAFLTYLKKLDDIARLDIVGMHLEENEKGNQNDDILHVFGRTNGNTRVYYYRRYEYGYWTPWEKITLNIEGEHLFPVIWKKRLFLFWLSIIEKPAEVDRTKKPQVMGGEAWGEHAKTNVEINMCWGEYYKGKWASPKSADLNSPVRFDNVSGFKRSNILLYARTEKKPNQSERLIFNIYDVNTASIKFVTVTYTSKNAAPIVKQEGDKILAEDVALFNFKMYRAGSTVLNHNTIIVQNRELNLHITQPPNAAKKNVIEKVLTKQAGLFSDFTLLPIRHKLENQFEGPFFYNDEQNVFFVRQDEEIISTIENFRGYYDVGILEIDKSRINIPLLVEEPIPGWPPKREGIFREDLVSNPWVFNETVISRNENVKRLIPSQNTFNLGTNRFSPGGKLPDGLKDILDLDSLNF